MQILDKGEMLEQPNNLDNKREMDDDYRVDIYWIKPRILIMPCCVIINFLISHLTIIVIIVIIM